MHKPINDKIKVNDIELYYEQYGQGAPLLILHGFTGSSAGLADLFKDLSKNHLLIIPDLRGHGKSTNPSKAFTHRQAALDIFELLNHLDIKQCSAVGFSAGGNILLHMAIQKPDMFQSMSVISATPYFPDQARNLMRQYNAIEKTQTDWQAMRKIHLLGDEQIKMIWQQASAFSESYDDMNISTSELSKIQAKTLIIQGDRDPFYPIEISVEMYRNISKSLLWIIPNGGHVPLSAEFIPLFIEYLSNFFQN